MMVSRNVGILVLPTIATSVFKPLGAISLMFIVLISSILAILATALIILLVRQYGEDGKLFLKRNMRNEVK